MPDKPQLDAYGRWLESQKTPMPSWKRDLLQYLAKVSGGVLDKDPKVLKILKRAP